MKKGFTLIEITIVLVIIGLLLGGILVGRSLTRWTQLTSLQSQVTQVGIQVSQFRMTYGAVPGEYLDAITAWPQILNGPEGAIYCNSRTTIYGSINNLIDGTFDNEGAFAQLQAAGMLPMGKPQIYQDGTSPANWTCFANNMQQRAALATKINNVYGLWTSYDNTSGMTFGAALQPIMTGAEALALDQKYDDSMPNTGLIRGIRTADGSGFCNTGVLTTSTYSDLGKFTCYVSIAYPSYYNTN